MSHRSDSTLKHNHWIFLLLILYVSFTSQRLGPHLSHWVHSTDQYSLLSEQKLAQTLHIPHPATAVFDHRLDRYAEIIMNLLLMHSNPASYDSTSNLVERRQAQDLKPLHKDTDTVLFPSRWRPPGKDHSPRPQGLNSWQAADTHPLEPWPRPLPFL